MFYVIIRRCEAEVQIRFSFKEKIGTSIPKIKNNERVKNREYSHREIVGQGCQNSIRA